MSNLTVQQQRPNPADHKDNEHGYHDTYTMGRDYRPPLPKPIDFRVYAVWGLTGVIGFLVFFAVYSLWKFAYCYSGTRYETCAKLDAAEPFAFALVLALPLVLIGANVVLKMIARYRYDTAMAHKAGLVLNRFGDNEPANLFARITPEQIVAMLADRYLMATALERTVAVHKVYRGVNSLSLSNTTNHGDNLLEGPADAGLAALPPEKWLPIVDEAHHVMLAGATGEGKTITAKALLYPRLQAGDQLFIIDPHSSNWYGIAGRAGGEDWQDAKEAIADVFGEYKARVDERHRHLLETGAELPHNHFTRLNVIVDEAFLVKENLDTGTSKRQINYWSLLAAILSSGARKVDISVIVLTQTANVEDLGISGPLRRNFFRIAVDAPSIRLMIAREETNHERKQQLYEGLIGLQYPATAEIGGQIHLLDRFGLLPMAQAPVDARAALWIPPAGRSFVRDGQNPHTEAPGRTNERTNGNIINTLVDLRRQGFTREYARQSAGLTFTDTDWTIAGEIINSAS